MSLPRPPRLRPPAGIRPPWHGHVPLSVAEWDAYRGWQRSCLQSWTLTHAALARAQHDRTELAAGRVYCFRRGVHVGPGIPLDSLPVLLWPEAADLDCQPAPAQRLAA